MPEASPEEKVVETSSATSKPRVAVLQHIECEGLGTLEGVLADHLDLHVLPAFADDRRYHDAVEQLVRNQDYQAVIALGGPMSVYERTDAPFLDDSLRLLRAALHRGVPILGICLGAQLLAYSLGAQVMPGRTLGFRKEIGWFPVALTERGKVDPALRGFRSGERLFHWHGDTFALPEGAWHLVRSGLYPNQGFRWGRWAYGLQFHLEVTADMVARWVQEYAAELDELPSVDRVAIIEEALVRSERLAHLAAALGRHFVSCVTAYSREANMPLAADSATGPKDVLSTLG